MCPLARRTYLAAGANSRNWQLTSIVRRRRTAVRSHVRRRQHAFRQAWILKIACFLGADRWNARDQNQFIGRRQLHHLTRREQRPGRLLT